MLPHLKTGLFIEACCKHSQYLLCFTRDTMGSLSNNTFEFDYPLESQGKHTQ